MESEKYEEAVRDYEKVCKMDRSRGKVIVVMWGEATSHHHRLVSTVCVKLGMIIQFSLACVAVIS